MPISCPINPDKARWLYSASVLNVEPCKTNANKFLPEKRESKAFCKVKCDMQKVTTSINTHRLTWDRTFIRKPRKNCEVNIR